MNIKHLIGFGLTAGLLSSAAYAQENVTTGFDPVIEDRSMTSMVGWTAGVSAATRFNTSDDFDHLENEVEGFVELTYGGFHTGLSATSLYQDPSDDVEFEANLGYGADFGQGLSWDLTYGYIWLNDSKDHSEEITATLGFPIGRDASGAFAVIIDPDNGESDQEVAFEAPLSERWTAVGLIGNSDRDDNIYAEAGAVYDFGDGVTFEALYEDTNDGDGVLGFTVSYEIGG
ncbi:hypothetical protein [Sulfitobacter sp. 1A12056]|uniref:hypothetical protein n=1 Tax=Sulfitobacter sp. 1A12056 TaxID=3368592 RepID=UPI003745E2AF